MGCALAALGYWVGGRREIQTCTNFFTPRCTCVFHSPKVSLAGEERLLLLDVPHLDGAVHRAGGEHMRRAGVPRHLVEGDPSRWEKPPVDLGLPSSIFLLGQQVATQAAYHQPRELSENKSDPRIDGSPCRSRRRKRLRGTGRGPPLFSAIHSFIRALRDPSSQYLGKKGS